MIAMGSTELSQKCANNVVTYFRSPISAFCKMPVFNNRVIIGQTRYDLFNLVDE